MSSKGAGDVAPNVASLPLAHQVLEKYIRALGGEAAIQKVSSRIEEGTFTVFGKLKFPVEVFAKAPDKRVVVMHMPNGDSTAGFDGHIGWLGSPGRPVREMSGAELGGEKLNAEFYFPVRLRQILSEVHVEHRTKSAATKSTSLQVGRRDCRSSGSTSTSSLDYSYGWSTMGNLRSDTTPRGLTTETTATKMV